MTDSKIPQEATQGGEMSAEHGVAGEKRTSPVEHEEGGRESKKKRKKGGGSSICPHKKAPKEPMQGVWGVEHLPPQAHKALLQGVWKIEHLSAHAPKEALQGVRGLRHL
jgi:hypothetical protein